MYQIKLENIVIEEPGCNKLEQESLNSRSHEN